jgi:murein DD-endopeptidase MepM/ murein hydrolase activator NlpD
MVVNSLTDTLFILALISQPRKGTPVIAAGSGKVIWAGYGVYRGGYDKTDPYGLAVTIRHDFGYQNQTLYYDLWSPGSD